MKAQDAIRKALENAGESQASASGKLGKSRNYVNSLLAQADATGGTIGCDTAAAMLGVCGYSLAAMPKGEEPSGALVIDPPGEQL